MGCSDCMRGADSAAYVDLMGCGDPHRLPTLWGHRLPIPRQDLREARVRSTAGDSSRFKAEVREERTKASEAVEAERAVAGLAGEGLGSVRGSRPPAIDLESAPTRRQLDTPMPPPKRPQSDPEWTPHGLSVLHRGTLAGEFRRLAREVLRSALTRALE